MTDAAMNTLTPDLEPDEKSPVANQNPIMRWGFGIVVVIGIIYLILQIIKGDAPKPKKEETPQDKTPVVATAPALPTHAALPLSAQQITNLKQHLTNVEDDMAKQRQAEELKLERMREVASTQVYNDGNSVSQTNSSTESGDVLGGNGGGDDANSRFMARVSTSAAPRSNATHIKHLSTTLAQGSTIAATLESRIQSDLPGMVRAVTQNDIYSETGTNLLIPKGSRLVGQYASAIAQGQNRVFVVWQRLIRPDGIDVQLNSPGTDSLGGAGIEANHVNNHFVQQFGQAALLSIIGAGVATLGVNPRDEFNSLAAYRSGLAQSFNQTAQTNFRNQGMIKPTLYIHQGAAIQVFVARDLDFYQALKAQY